MFKVKIPESVAYDHPSWSSSLYSPSQSPYWTACPRPDPKLSSQRLSKAMEPSVPSITVADIEVRRILFSPWGEILFFSSPLIQRLLLVL